MQRHIKNACNKYITGVKKALWHLDREIKRLNDDVIEAHEMCDECVKIAEHFNKLPWYKKMLYKFKL